jgi:hypothetical protein
MVDIPRHDLISYPELRIVCVRGGEAERPIAPVFLGLVPEF